MADETAEHRAFVAWFQTLDMQQRINVWYDCEAQTAAEVRGYLEGHLGKLQAGESRAQAAEQQVEQLKADLSAALRLVELRSVRCTCHSGPLRAGQVHADWCALRQSKDSSPAGGAPVPRTAPHPDWCCCSDYQSSGLPCLPGKCPNNPANQATRAP